MSNTGNTQQIIDYGATANDGTGDPLRTAFIKTDENFSNIWAAGPVGSNITIANNTIQNDSINGNIIIKPNGVGVIQANASILPSIDGVRDLGSNTRAWRRAYINIANITELSIQSTLDVIGDAVIQGNLTVEGDTIQIGNITTDTLLIQLANAAANSAQADGAGVTVGANDDIATMLYDATGNRWEMNIGLSAAGNIAAPYFIGNGALLTGITTYANANAAAYGQAGWAGNIIPAANAYYSLGDSTRYWSNLWVANNTIYIGGVPLGMTSGNVLTVNGNAVLSNDSNTSITTSGDITATTVTATDSADLGSLNIYAATISMNDDQWDNITIAPNIEGSAFLQLPKDSVADEQNVRLHNDAGNVEIGTGSGSYNWLFDNAGNLNAPGNIITTGQGNVIGNVEGLIGNITNLNTLNFDVTNISAQIGNNGVNIGAGGFNNLVVLPTEVTIQNVPLYLTEANLVGTTTPYNAGYLRWVGDSSGDGSGYTTLQLIPDETVTASDQYLIIDPTGGGHIHIRAGGTQDDSLGQLYLGGEDNFVRVVDNQGLTLQNLLVTQSTNNYADPADFTSATWFSESGSYYIQYTSTNAQLDVDPFQDINNIYISWNSGVDSATLTYGGGTYNLGGGVYKVQVNEVPAADPTAFDTLDYTLNITTTNTVTLDDNGFNATSENDATLTGNGFVEITNFSNTEGVTIRTDQSGNAYAWTFGVDANLTLPDGGSVIIDTDGAIGPVSDDLVIRWDNEEIRVVSVGGGVELQADNDVAIQTGFDSGSGDYQYKWVFTNNNEIVNITGNSAIVTEAGSLTLSGGRDGLASGNVAVVAVNNSVAVSTWSFDNTGNFTLPPSGNLVGATPNNNGYLNWFGNSSGDGGGYTTMNIVPDDTRVGGDQYLIIDPTAPGHIHIRAGGTQDNSSAEIYLGGENSYFKVDAGPNPDVVVATDGEQWRFSLGQLILANGLSTIQSLASSSLDPLNPNVSTMTFTPDPGYGSQALVLDPTSVGHIHLRAPAASGNIDDPVANLFLGGELSSFEVGIGYGSPPDVYIHSNDNTWTFDNTGNLTLPGNTFAVNYANGTAISLGGNYGNANVVANLAALGSNPVSTTGNVTAGYFIGNGSQLTGLPASYSNANVATFLASYGSNTISTSGNITAGNLIGNISITGNVTGTSSNVDIIAGSYQWTFNNAGNLVLPGNTFTVNYANGTAVTLGGTYGNANVVANLAALASNPVSTTGNVTAGNVIVSGAAITGVNALLAGPTFTPLANTAAGFVANVNNYSQVTFQNKNTGADATADFILTADNGSDTVNYGDFGIINSGYDVNTPTNSLGNIVRAGDTYIYSQGNVSNTSQSGGNLVIGTTVAGKTVKIFAGGNTASALVANISNTGISVTGNVTANTFIGNVSLTGNIQGTSANVELVAGVYTWTFDNTGQATFPGNISVTGNVITPNLPAFRVTGSGNTVNLGNTINSTGNLNINNFTVDYNQGSYLNTSTGVFTAPVAGLYSVHLVARTSGNNNATSQIAVMKNGTTQQAFWEVAANSTVGHMGVSSVAKLAVGDTLVAKILIGQINFDANDSWSVAFLG